MLESPVVIFIPTILEAEKIFNIYEFKIINNFNTATYRSYPVIITGCGKSNASVTSALFFSQYKPKYPLLTGICGAYHNCGINIADTVSIKDDFFVDECNYDGNKITLLHEKGFTLTEDNKGRFQVFNKLKEVNSNTVSFIPQIDSLSNMYHEKTKALVENMEGAAFASAANKFNIYPYHIRSVSNYCGNINMQNWDIKKASASLKKAVDLFIDTFQSG